jgi:uncharacterized protein YqeY
MSSSISLQIKQDMIQAMKDRNDIKKTVLRTLSSELKNFEIDKGDSLDDSDVIKVLRRLEKQRMDSIQAYRDGGREDLVTNEEQELLIIQEYLPEKLSEEVIIDIINQGIQELGSDVNLGSLMKYVISKTQGQADGNTIRTLVQSKLEQ